MFIRNNVPCERMMKFTDCHMDEVINLSITTHAKSAQVQWLLMVQEDPQKSMPEFSHTRQNRIAELKAVGKQIGESSSMCEGYSYRKSMFPLFFQVPVPMSSHVVLSAGSETLSQYIALLLEIIFRLLWKVVVKRKKIWVWFRLLC